MMIKIKITCNKILNISWNPIYKMKFKYFNINNLGKLLGILFAL